MDSFFIIVGLGNPGRKYDGTRHNVGFDVIDELVDRFHIGGPEKFGKSMIGKGRIGDRKVILVKPMTYMNLSGEAVQEIVHFFKVDPGQDLVIISDDIDLEVGQLRIRKKGSAGGHNGLKNIVQHLGGGEFARIRVGVGGKPNADYALMDYVLGHFSGGDKKVMEDAVSKAADAVACMVTDGVDLAMNRYNTPRKKKKKTAEEAAGKAEKEAAGIVAKENGKPAQAGNGKPAQAENGEATQAGNGEAAQAGNGKPAQAGNGKPAQAGNGEAAQAGNGEAAQTGNGEAAQAGNGKPAQAGNGEAAQTGNGEAGSAETAGGAPVKREAHD